MSPETIHHREIFVLINSINDANLQEIKSLHLLCFMFSTDMDRYDDIEWISRSGFQNDGLFYVTRFSVKFSITHF